MNEDKLGADALRPVACDRVCVIETPMFGAVQLDLTDIVETCQDAAVGTDVLDDGEIPIGNARGFVGWQ